MPEPTPTDCDTCYKACKCKCFDNLVTALALAGGDVGKEQDARDAYMKCRDICKKAKAICDSIPA
ncbi:MAG TPA: hypothetical protein VI756_22510 [Blastocatellia bacterium]